MEHASQQVLMTKGLYQMVKHTERRHRVPLGYQESLIWVFRVKGTTTEELKGYAWIIHKVFEVQPGYSSKGYYFRKG